MINMNAPSLSKLSVLWNRCMHNIIGIKSYKMTTTTIMKKLEWLSFPQMVQLESMKLLHKVVYEMIPPSLSKYLHFSMHRSDIARLTRKPSLKYKYKTSKSKNSFFHRTCYIYNHLPDEIRTLNTKKFSKEVKNHIKNNYDLKNIPKIPN